MIGVRKSGLWVAAALLLLIVSGCGGSSSDPGGSEQPLRIGSWNLLHLGWDNGKNLRAVAAVAAQFDLLAIQELMDPVALRRLDKQLEQYTGVSWGHLASEAEGRTGYQEHYGFVWRRDRVMFTGKAITYIDAKQRFAREPFSALFIGLRHGKTIALATVHIVFGDSQADRRPEIRALSDYWHWFRGTYSDADVYVLAGDMNMPPGDPAWNELERSARALITDHATTLSTSPHEYASLYDQIVVADHWARNHAFAAGVFVYPRAYDWGWSVREAVSDHLPVYVVLGHSGFQLREFGANLDTIISGDAPNRPACIRLNGAPSERLVALPHVGPVMARAIVDGRPWSAIDELVQIDGLSAAYVQDIKATHDVCIPVKPRR